MLDEKEEYYIEKYDSYKNGYNSTKGGKAITSKLQDDIVKQKRINTFKNNPFNKGEHHHNSRFTKEEVIAIRNRAMNGEKCDHVYEDYKHKVKNSQSFKLVYFGKTWKHLLSNGWEDRPILYTNAMFTIYEIKDIKKRYKEGEKVRDIHKFYSSYNYKTIYDISTNRNYKHITVD